MVKSVLGVKHQGLQDWALQRVSAILMAIYTIAFVIYLMLNGSGLSYAEWHYLFAQDWMKIATFLFIECILIHAWIGMWTIFTDYVKFYPIRCILNCLVLLLIAVCSVWALLILWSV
jgi:succinate dehydrogenase / fumarate reductase membrane anchor subunit